MITFLFSVLTKYLDCSREGFIHLYCSTVAAAIRHRREIMNGTKLHTGLRANNNLSVPTLIV